MRRRSDNIAYCIDLDKEVLEWGKQHKILKLTTDQQRRIHAINDNVLTVKTEPTDIALAMNFSYWLLKRKKTDN